MSVSSEHVELEPGSAAASADVRTDARAAQQAANAPVRNYRFAAVTGVGGSALRISTHCAVADHLVQLKLDAAVVLAALEPLCLRLERALGHPLDFKRIDRPGLTPVATDSRAMQFTTVVECRDLVDRGIDTLTVTVDVQESMWSANTAVASRLAENDDHWIPVDATLELGRVTLCVADRAAYGPGALVLLPSSFEPDWRCRLRFADDRYALDVRLDAVAGHLTCEPDAHPGRVCHDVSTADEELCIDWDPVVPLGAPTLLGNMERPQLLSAAVVDGECRCRRADGVVHSASLVRIGAGFAALIGGALPPESMH